MPYAADVTFRPGAAAHALQPEDYQNLLMCVFMDDLASVFQLAMLQKCMVDSWEVWDDFEALALRPFGCKEVWIGYDPQKARRTATAQAAW